MKGVIVKEFKGNGNWYILGEDGIEYYLGFRQCVNKEKYFKKGVSVTFEVKDTGGKRLEAWNCVAEEPPKPVVTNYARIHHMNVEELARTLYDTSWAAWRSINGEGIWTEQDWLDWLKQEAEDG